MVVCAVMLVWMMCGGVCVCDDDWIGWWWMFYVCVFEYVEGGLLVWEVVLTVAYVGVGRRGRRAVMVMVIVVVMMVYGVWWMIGVLVFVCVFYVFVVVVCVVLFSVWRKRTYVWVACVLAYLVLDELESELGDVVCVGIMNVMMFNCYCVCCFDLLCVMCFGVECVEESATLDFGKFVRYVLYSFLRVKGFFCFYREFE